MPTSGRWWRLNPRLVIWLRLVPDADKLRRSSLAHDCTSKNAQSVIPPSAAFSLGEGCDLSPACCLLVSRRALAPVAACGEATKPGLAPNGSINHQSLATAETGRVEGCDRSAQRNGSNYIYNSDSAVPGTCTAAFELRMQECGYDRNLLV